MSILQDLWAEINLRCVSYFIAWNQARYRLGPGDRARPRRVRGRQRPRRQVRRGGSRGHRRQVSQAHLPLGRLHRYTGCARVATRAILAGWRGLIEYQQSDIRCLILKAKMI